MQRSIAIALFAACLMAVAAAVAWRLEAPALAAVGSGASAKQSPALEIRWHGNGIVLQGRVQDVATQRALAEGAAARLGGEAGQVVDWLDIVPTALPVADPAALAGLIKLGQEGWHLQRMPCHSWLAMQSIGDERSEQARALLHRAFGPDATIELVALPPAGSR